MKFKPFVYKVSASESEKASNSYLMSVVALIAGLPLPVVNLIATLIFFLAYRRASYFVRWHCTQALLSQVSVIFFNSFAFWWTIDIFFGDRQIDNSYIAYMLTILLLNLMEFIATIIAAIRTRRGEHVEWYFIGPLTNLLCKPDHHE